MPNIESRPGAVPPATAVGTSPSATPVGAAGIQTGGSAPRKAPVPAKARFGFNAMVCLGYSILIVVVFLILITIAVARTGIVTIPLASRLYHGPSPTRIVTAGVTEPDAFQDALSLKVALAVKKGGTPPFEVTVDETELTAAMRGALSGSLRGSEILAERPQIVITPDAIEFSGRFVRGSIAFDVLARFKPEIRGSELVFNPTNVEFGDYPISTSTARDVLGLLFKRDFGSWRLEVGDAGLEDIRLLDGKAVLVLNPRKTTP
ncbi:MAG TPA: hypothetical protein VN397_04185 [Candidatus Methylomirabilis sp.]|nr:hypothetical protein [Candidatus Methylomirabilis sp.]